MEPEEWQSIADSAAQLFRAELVLLERDCDSALSNGSARGFWSKIRELSDRVRTAPAIRLEDKLTLHHSINALCQRARQVSKELHHHSTREKLDLCERTLLARETLSENANIADVHGVQAELAELRERLKRAERTMRREDRQAVWNTWQEANQAAWQTLVQLRMKNERVLSALLDDAEESISSGNARKSKDQIKAFHTQAAQLECPRHALRPLRDRAHQLWQRADQVAKQKHAAYLDHARKRLRQMQVQYRRNAQTADGISRDVVMLEQLCKEATTDVAAAMARGRLAERRRALADMLAFNQNLKVRMDGFELALNEA